MSSRLRNVWYDNLISGHLVIYRCKVGARLGQARLRQRRSKSGARKIEPKSPKVGQKHWARPEQGPGRIDNTLKVHF